MLPSHGLRRTRPADLPSWEELNVGRSRVEKRRLSPDAIVELRAERTRVFVDDEMGFGPLPRSAENARAWAFARLTRYASFMVRGGNRTLYAQKYPDRWKARLVLLTPSEERASTLTEVITEWQEVNRSVPLVARALTMRHAAGDGADACLRSAAVLAVARRCSTRASQGPARLTSAGCTSA